MAILGDVYTPGEARTLNDLARDLRADHPYKAYVIVPKCRAAFDIIDENVVLGYPMGYADVQAEDIADPSAWRGRKVHLLGASPHRQFAVIETLTQPTLVDDPPADIVGLDWNGVQKVAYLGEYWTPDGWQRADHLSIRETVRTSLREIKAFWQERGVWPATEPRDLYSPAVRKPDDPVYVVNGADITSREQLESSFVAEYEEYGTLAFQSETEQRWVEYREGLNPMGRRRRYRCSLPEKGHRTI